MRLKNHKIIFLILSGLLVLLPVLTMDHTPNKVSKIDNRKLTDLRDYDGNFPHWLKSYVEDRMGGREAMINAYLMLNDKLFHQLEHPIYTYGKEGEVFFKMKPNRRYEPYHDTFVDFVVKLQQYCESRGIPFYFQMEPEKASTYRQFLPAGVHYEDQWVHTLMSKLQQRGVKVVDNVSLLADKAKEERVFNVKDNAGHWNDVGAYYAMNHLFEKMNKDFPAMQPLPKNFFRHGSHVEETLPESNFPIREEIPDWDLKEPFENLTDAYCKEVRVVPQFPYVHYFINPTPRAKVLPKVLIFQGSYLNSWNQFLIANTRENMGIHDYQNVLQAPYYINLFQPEAVVFEVGEYTVEDYYFDEKGMKAADFAPAMKAEDLAQKATQPVSLLRDVQKQKNTQVTEITFAIDRENIRYAYLAAGDKVYDLQKTDKKDVFLLALQNYVSLPQNKTQLYYYTQEGQWRREENVGILFNK